MSNKFLLLIFLIIIWDAIAFEPKKPFKDWQAKVTKDINTFDIESYKDLNRKALDSKREELEREEKNLNKELKEFRNNQTLTDLAEYRLQQLAYGKNVLQVRKNMIIAEEGQAKEGEKKEVEQRYDTRKTEFEESSKALKEKLSKYLVSIGESFEKPTERKEIPAKEPSESSTKTGKIEPSVEKIPKEQIVQKIKDANLQQIKDAKEFTEKINELVNEANRLEGKEKTEVLQDLSKEFQAGLEKLTPQIDYNWTTINQFVSLDKKIQMSLESIESLNKQFKGRYNAISFDRYEDRLVLLRDWYSKLSDYSYKDQSTVIENIIDELNSMAENVVTSGREFLQQEVQNFESLVSQKKDQVVKQLSNDPYINLQIKKKGKLFGHSDYTEAQELVNQLQLNGKVPLDQIKTIQEYVLFEQDITEYQAQALLAIVEYIPIDDLQKQFVKELIKKSSQPGQSLVAWISQGFYDGTKIVGEQATWAKEQVSAVLWEGAKWGAPKVLEVTWNIVSKAAPVIFTSFPPELQAQLQVQLVNAQEFLENFNSTLNNITTVAGVIEKAPEHAEAIIKAAKFIRDNAQSIRIWSQGLGEIGQFFLMKKENSFVKLTQILQKIENSAKKPIENEEAIIKLAELLKNYAKDAKPWIQKAREASIHTQTYFSKIFENTTRLMADLPLEQQEEIKNAIIQEIPKEPENIPETITQETLKESGDIPETITQEAEPRISFFQQKLNSIIALAKKTKRLFVSAEKEYQSTRKKLISTLKLTEPTLSSNDFKNGIIQALGDKNNPDKALLVKNYLSKLLSLAEEMSKARANIFNEIINLQTSGQAAITEIQENVYQQLDELNEKINEKDAFAIVAQLGKIGQAQVPFNDLKDKINKAKSEVEDVPALKESLDAIFNIVEKQNSFFTREFRKNMQNLYSGLKKIKGKP